MLAPIIPQMKQNYCRIKVKVISQHRKSPAEFTSDIKVNDEDRKSSTSKKQFIRCAEVCRKANKASGIVKICRINKKALKHLACFPFLRSFLRPAIHLGMKYFIFIIEQYFDVYFYCTSLLLYLDSAQHVKQSWLYQSTQTVEFLRAFKVSWASIVVEHVRGLFELSSLCDYRFQIRSLPSGEI